MKKQQGDYRETLICAIEKWYQNKVRNAKATDHCDAVDATGTGYEIKGWNGSWHKEGYEKLINKERNKDNTRKFVNMLQSHKASHYVPIWKDSKGNEYYMIIPFNVLIQAVERFEKINWYRIEKESGTTELKFRPTFSIKHSQIFQNKGYEIKRLK